MKQPFCLRATVIGNVNGEAVSKVVEEIRELGGGKIRSPFLKAQFLILVLWTLRLVLTGSELLPATRVANRALCRNRPGPSDERMLMAPARQRPNHDCKGFKIGQSADWWQSWKGDVIKRSSASLNCSANVFAVRALGLVGLGSSEGDEKARTALAACSGRWHAMDRQRSADPYHMSAEQKFRGKCVRDRNIFQ
ncbi:hypothetical protein B0H14DRAFT_2638344 [Mycena olivaceomarginata]|nr:hypothetical protein B0H14DRAFT_2638344 [Mycena olivaceomarginata]